MQFLFEEFPGRQFGEIFRDVDAGLSQLQQFNQLLFFTRAENNAERLFLLRAAFVFVQPAI